VDREAAEMGASDFLIKDRLEPVMLERVIRYSVQQAAALQALQRSHERFRLLFERSLDAILISTDSGRFVEVNGAACRLLGLKRKELLQMKWSGLPLMASYKTHERLPAGLDELCYIKRGGKRCFIEFTSTPLAPDLNLSILRDVTEHRALEDEIQEISEREQRRLGQDMHDGVGQAMAGIAFLAKVLQQKLQSKGLPEAEDAGKIACLINDALAQTRSLCRGLCPAVLDSNDIRAALEQLAENVRMLFSVACELRCQREIKISDNAVAVHLFRIAQEAATNAIKHGGAKNLLLSLELGASRLILKIKDDGRGFTPAEAGRKGMGLRVMHHRARMIGATLSVRQRKQGGVIVTCSAPWRRN
jgi:PAS domain S-box-containing protein